MNALLQPSEADDINASVIADATRAIEKLRTRLEEAEQAVSFGYVRGALETRRRT